MPILLYYNLQAIYIFEHGTRWIEFHNEELVKKPQYLYIFCLHSAAKLKNMGHSNLVA